MIALVTDSTACLPSDLVELHDITVVRLHLLVDGASYVEGIDMDAAAVADALHAHRWVSTSKPSAGDFLDAYQRLAHAGAEAILSVHLSSEMSGTVSSAEVAATESPVPVRVVDSRSLGMGMGYAAVSAAQVLAGGGSLAVGEGTVRRRAAASDTTFYVDTLEYLRRGGRIGRASALVGSALAIKPLLGLQDGTVGSLERVRTTSKALARLEEITVAHVEKHADNDHGVDVAVQYLDAGERAEALGERLRERVADRAEVRLVGLGAVIAAHVGPGTIGTVVSPRVRTTPPTIGAVSLEG